MSKRKSGEIMQNMKISFLEHICSTDEIFKWEPDLSRDIQTSFPVGKVEACSHRHIDKTELGAGFVF